MPIFNTLNVLCKHAEVAEKRVRDSVENNFPGADEEKITTLFQEKFSEELRLASNQGEIASAFAIDLQNAGMSYEVGEATQVASGLLAEVSWHDKRTEKVTGGDFGLMIKRPTILNDGSTLSIAQGVENGLLVQAKRMPFNGRIGNLTPNQKKVLPKRLSYLSLVLYRLSDSDNRQLESFLWRNCAGANLTTVKDWLKTFSTYEKETKTTEQILRLLESGAIGTNDRTIIQNVISPEKNPVIVVEVKWKDGAGPATSVFVLNKPVQEDHIHVHIERET